MRDTGFIYYVTLRGVTGSSNLGGKESEKKIRYIKYSALITVMAGWGRESIDDPKLLG
jgi:Tryptophan synthase alpha chain